jgi:hypothetical protein
MRYGIHTTANPARSAKAYTQRSANRIRVVLIIPIVAMLLFGSGQIFAQAGIDMGSVTGTVKDPSGALVAKAQCTLTDTATGVSQKTVSTSAGAYTFSLVPVGSYSLKVAAPGFKDYLLKGIDVHLGNAATEDVSLSLGAASAEVTVTSAAPLLQAQDASLGMTINTQIANDLPITGGAGGRSFLDLLTIAPGAQPVSNQLINGVQNGALDVRVNGADDNNEVFGGQNISPIPDTIQEFKLQSGDNGADLGRSYGSVVNVVTKTGTNKFRGEVWEYNENDMYNANDYFNKLHQLVTNATKTPNRPGKFKENSFGGIYSGPVVIPHVYNGHNRTFFTADFQYTYYNTSSTYTGTVPTSTMQDSGFTNLSDVLRLSTATKIDPLGRTFQVGTMFDPATTRWVPCGSTDPITGLSATCASNQVGVVQDPNIYNGAKVAVLRDPFVSGGSCPSLGNKNWVSTFAGGTVPMSCLNQLTAGHLDPNAIALLKLFPAGNQTDVPTKSYGSNFIELLQNPTVTKQYDVRVDHTFNDKDSAFVTFSTLGRVSTPQPPYEGPLEGGGSTGFWSHARNYMVVLTETHVFNPHLVNEFRAADEQVRNTNSDPDNIDNTFGTPAQFGIQGIPQTANNGGLPVIDTNAVSEFGSRVNITWSKDGAWTFSDALTATRGKHELKLGGEFWQIYGDIAQLPYSRGRFTYGQYSNLPGGGDGDPGISDFLLLPSFNVASSGYIASGANVLSTPGHVLGGVNGYNGNNWNKSTYHAPYIAVYATDSWKITPTLTASLGLRYEYFGPFSSDRGQEANFWMGGNGNDAAGSAYYVGHDGCATTTSSYFKGLMAYDSIPIICQPGNSVNKAPKANWAPRLGLAYRILPNLVVRAGAGIAYGAFNSIGYGGTLGTNYPFRTSVQQGPNNPYTPQLIGPTGDTTATMENTFSLINMTNPNAAFITPGSLAMYGKPYHFKTPYTTSLDVAVQWQFTHHDSIQATYVGSLGKQLESGDPYHNAPRQVLTSGTPAVSSCTPAQLASNPYCENSPLMADGDGTTTIPFPNLAPNSGPMENTGQISNYHSAEIEYQHDFAHGFTMDSNYTFTSCLSDAQGGQQNEGGPGNGRAPWVVGFGGYRTDYDRCENTSAQVFKLSGEYSLPFGKGAPWAANANGVEDAVIGGWKLDPIWVSSSGVLSNIACQGTNGYGANPGFTGPWFQTANTAWACNAPTVPGQHLYGPGSKDLHRTRITGYWNSSAFTAPQSAVTTNGQQDFSPFGIRGDQIYGPGWYNVDLSTHKDFNFSETRKFEIVAEAFNVFNHPELNNPNNGTGANSYTSPSQESLTAGFGTITGSRHGPRTWEFAGKLFF